MRRSEVAGRRQRSARSSQPTRNAGDRPSTLGLIGLDLAERSVRISPRRVLPAVVAALVVALGMAALRTELLRVRYALAEATLEEQRLLDEERALKAERRKLRDPVHLARRANELGFVRPEYLVDLPTDPARRDPAFLAAVTGSSTVSPERP